MQADRSILRLLSPAITSGITPAPGVAPIISVTASQFGCGGVGASNGNGSTGGFGGGGGGATGASNFAYNGGAGGVCGGGGGATEHNSGNTSGAGGQGYVTLEWLEEDM